MIRRRWTHVSNYEHHYDINHEHIEVETFFSPHELGYDNDYHYEHLQRRWRTLVCENQRKVNKDKLNSAELKLLDTNIINLLTMTMIMNMTMLKACMSLMSLDMRTMTVMNFFNKVEGLLLGTRRSRTIKVILSWPYKRLSEIIIQI